MSSTNTWYKNNTRIDDNRWERQTTLTTTLTFPESTPVFRNLEPRLRFGGWVVRRFFHSTFEPKDDGAAYVWNQGNELFQVHLFRALLMSVSHVSTPKTTCESCKKLPTHLHPSQNQKKTPRTYTINNNTFTTIINIHQLSCSWMIQTTFLCFLLSSNFRIQPTVPLQLRCRSSWPGGVPTKVETTICWNNPKFFQAVLTEIVV